MAQRCKVCALPDRHEIDMGLVNGTVTQGAVARRYGLTESSVKRHKQNHLPKMLATLSHRVEALEADQILGQIIGLYERSLTALDRAESYANDSDQAKAVPALIREARANLEVMAKVSVGLNDARRTETTVVENTLETEISRALAARAARGPVVPGGNTGSTAASGAHEPIAALGQPDTSGAVDAEIVG